MMHVVALLFTALPRDVCDAILACVDIQALLALQMVSRQAIQPLSSVLEWRCKQACFSAYLYPTIASYRMLVSVPSTWKQLYLLVSSLREMSWTTVRKSGTSSSLRSLKSDNQEYVADMPMRYLLRSGGHYWFSVWQTRLLDVDLTAAGDSEQVDQAGIVEEMASSERGNEGNGRGAQPSQRPRNIVIGKWEKIRGGGSMPCPRRHHSMTCLSDVTCSQHLLTGCDSEESKGTVNGSIPVRRVVFFGGQSEGIPFEPFNDLHLLLLDGRETHDRSSKTLARWITPLTTGNPPSPRCGHAATLLSPQLLLISGGSAGTAPISTLEIYLLHVEDDTAFGHFRWSTPVAASPIPMGRAMHRVHRVASNEVYIFGGRQIRQSNGLLDVQRLQLRMDPEPTKAMAEWSSCTTTGATPTPRRGHSTTALGNHVLLIGGQAEVGGELYGDVRTLDVPSLRWRIPQVHGDSPCPRRGFKTQYFGTSLVISSGFVVEPGSGKVVQQLPEADIHLLSFR